jgi:hypothetical protein
MLGNFHFLCSLWKSLLLYAFAFHCSKYMQSTMVWKCQLENCRRKQFIGFILHTPLSSLMKFHAIYSVPLGRWIFLCQIYPHYITYLPIIYLLVLFFISWLSRHHNVCVQITLILINNDSKAQCKQRRMEWWCWQFLLKNFVMIVLFYN